VFDFFGVRDRLVEVYGFSPAQARKMALAQQKEWEAS
jgi:hypothetical protein